MECGSANRAPALTPPRRRPLQPATAWRTIGGTEALARRASPGVRIETFPGTFDAKPSNGARRARARGEIERSRHV